MATLSVCIITGEPSGDLLGARLMEAFRRATGGAVRFFGVGGEAMAAQGMVSLVDQSELAVMGFLEVVPKIPLILRRVRSVVAAIEQQQPDLVVTIDSWGFCKRVHQALKQRHVAIPHVHYVAPMVWAWKEKRARDVARWVDHLLCLLPQEPAYFTAHGLAATHVGHPVIEGGAARGEGAAFRLAQGIAAEVPVLLVLPGSRRSETDRLLPIFAQTVERLVARHPDLRVVVPTVATVAEVVRAQVALWPGQPVVVTGEAARYDAFAAATVALAASGTVSVEMALAGVPHVIAYRVAPVTAWIFRRLTSIRFVNLMNILENQAIVPEVLQEHCTPERLAQEVERLLSEPGAVAEQRAGFARAVARLAGGEGQRPSDRAVQVLLGIMEKAGGAAGLSSSS